MNKLDIINILNVINNKLWICVTIVIFLCSIYFTLKLKGIQFKFNKMFSSLIKKENSKDGISSFKVLMLSLAGRIGVGSISGVSLAIYLGGPGTIFWIWTFSFLSSILAYAETYLGISYKESDGNKIYKGGPAYYIKNGLNQPWLGGIYALFIIICYDIGFIGIQSNTITKSITGVLPYISPIVIGIILCFLTLFIIFGGIKKITDCTGKIVPIMSIFYVGLSFYVIFTNIDILPSLFKSIIVGAFNFKSFFSGFITTLLIGVQRGIFSNEAGIGTGSIAASSCNSDNATSQGYIQMLGVYITSILICTSTAIIILPSNYEMLNIIDPNGIEIASYAFEYHLGYFGNFFLILSIFLFAFSTILSGYYYGESSLKYFFNNTKRIFIICLKILTIMVIFFGSILPSTLLWNFIDILVGLLAIINIYAIIRLRKKIK